VLPLATQLRDELRTLHADAKAAKKKVEERDLQIITLKAAHLAETTQMASNLKALQDDMDDLNEELRLVTSADQSEMLSMASDALYNYEVTKHELVLSEKKVVAQQVSGQWICSLQSACSHVASNLQPCSLLAAM
jgi:tellurite resistance protein